MSQFGNYNIDWFRNVMEEHIERFNSWKFTDPKKKKHLKVKRKKRLFTNIKIIKKL